MAHDAFMIPANEVPTEGTIDRAESPYDVRPAMSGDALEAAMASLAARGIDPTGSTAEHRLDLTHEDSLNPEMFSDQDADNRLATIAEAKTLADRTAAQAEQLTAPEAVRYTPGYIRKITGAICSARATQIALPDGTLLRDAYQNNYATAA